MPVRSSATDVSRRSRVTKKKIPETIILMSKADVSDAFRDVWVDPDKAQSLLHSRRVGSD